MLTSGIKFTNFFLKKKNKKILYIFLKLINEKNFNLLSLSKSYKDKFTKKLVSKYKKIKNIRVIGMGGSSLGTQAIYYFYN